MWFLGPRHVYFVVIFKHNVFEYFHKVIIWCEGVQRISMLANIDIKLVYALLSVLT